VSFAGRDRCRTARPSYRRWWRALSFCVLTLLLGPAGPAQAQHAGRTDGLWQDAVDRYLSGDRSGAATLLLRASRDDLLDSSRRAFEQWRVTPASAPEVRRVAARRLQVSALMPLDVLIAVTGRALPSDLETALEDAARDAWHRLDAFDDGSHDDAERVGQFRTWWRIGLVQHLIVSGRFPDVPREVSAVRVADDDAAARAALALLRGVALETRARLADEAPAGTAAVTMRRLQTPSRMRPMLMAMEDAGKQYRRVLDLVAGHREATLRLARVAIERGRLDEAERVLAPLLAQPCRDAICGLAHLFAGEVRDARNDTGGAAGAYARASAVPSVRHSALVAMMQTSMRRGNAGGAYDVTRQFATPLALAPRQAPDAWSLYAAGRLIDTDLVLAQLRAVVLP